MRILEKLYNKSKDPVSESPLKIAFLGDSVTHGCFEIIEKENGRFDCVYDHNAVYHNRLKRKIETVFPNCPVTIVNAGISGGNAVQGAERVQRDVIETRPDLTVVCFGLNDVLSDAGLEGYSNGLRSIFRQLHEADMETVFMTPNMMCTYRCPQLKGDWLKQMGKLCSDAQNDGKMDEFMQRAADISKQEHVLLCDCYSNWKCLQSFGADITYLLSNYLNHPNREMHNLFADRLFYTILGGNILV